MNEQQIITLVQQKQRTKETFYIVFDGACEHNAVRHLFALEGVDSYQFLYFGTPYVSVMEYGPILAAVSAPSPFLFWFWEKCPEIHAGIALFSPLSPAVLAGQLQEILTVTMPEGPKSLFRFYDPRLVRRAVALTVKNLGFTLAKGISTLYAPRYTFGQAPVWEQVMEQNNG
jgi:hypothetical protein